MPLSDRDLYGRCKDFYPPILSAINAKITSLETEVIVAEQTKQLTLAFAEVKRTLLDFGKNLLSNQVSAEKLLKTMLYDLEQIFPGLALEEDQESSIFNIIDQTLLAIQKVADTSEENQHAFDNVIDILESISIQQQAITAINNEVLIKNHDLASIDNNLDGDIELF